VLLEVLLDPSIQAEQAVVSGGIRRGSKLV
jgi:hypothetical protein